jgi:hypothetical protein
MQLVRLHRHNELFHLQDPSQEIFPSTLIHPKHLPFIPTILLSFTILVSICATTTSRTYIFSGLIMRSQDLTLVKGRGIQRDSEPACEFPILLHLSVQLSNHNVSNLVFPQTHHFLTIHQPLNDNSSP